MSLIKEVKSSKLFIGRLDHGCDLIEELTKVCIENDITLGRVEAIGAVKEAVLGYYNTSTFEYEYHEFKEPMELLNLTGNVSIKDGQTMVHAHVTLADNKSKAIGGHLCPNTYVFACEYIIEKYEGNKLERGFDKETGLPLWPMK